MIEGRHQNRKQEAEGEDAAGEEQMGEIRLRRRSKGGEQNDKDAKE